VFRVIESEGVEACGSTSSRESGHWREQTTCIAYRTRRELREKKKEEERRRRKREEGRRF